MAKKETEKPPEETKFYQDLRLGGRKPKLKALMESNPLGYEKMLAAVRAGAYMHVVAAAVGVHPETLARWMSKGAEAASGMYRRFYEDMIQAAAQARVEIEIKVAKIDPKFWLTHGPGKWVATEGATWDSTEYREELITVKGEVQHNLTLDRAPVSDESLATALLELEKAGLVKLTEIGKTVITSEESQKRLTQSTPPDSGQVGEEVVDVEFESRDDLPGVEGGGV